MYHDLRIIYGVVSRFGNWKGKFNYNFSTNWQK